MTENGEKKEVFSKGLTQVYTGTAKAKLQQP